MFMKSTNVVKTALIILAAVSIAAAPGSAMSKGWAVPLEVVGGYGLGIGVTMLAFGASGGFDSHGGFAKGILAMFVVYPAASALGVYGVGELAEGDSTNDALTLGATLGASYGSFIGSFIFRDSFPAMAIILPPLVDTLVYNLVKEVEEKPVIHPDEGTYTHLISFSVGF
jgi:hypothetical protein